MLLVVLIYASRGKPLIKLHEIQPIKIKESCIMTTCDLIISMNNAVSINNRIVICTNCSVITDFIKAHHFKKKLNVSSKHKTQVSDTHTHTHCSSGHRWLKTHPQQTEAGEQVLIRFYSHTPITSQESSEGNYKKILHHAV